jgi:simple sugar transport system permease protein
MALLFGILVLLLLANQVAAGLALTIFGTGLSALIGKSFVGNAVPPPPKLDLPLLSDLPVIGPILFRQDAWSMAPSCCWLW